MAVPGRLRSARDGRRHAGRLGAAGIAEAYVRKLLEPDAPELDERHQDTLGALVAADPAGEAAETEVADYLVAQLDEPGGTARVARIQQLLTWLGPAAVDSVHPKDRQRCRSAPVILTAGALRDARAVEPLVATDRRARSRQARRGRHRPRPARRHARRERDDRGRRRIPTTTVRDSALQALNNMGVAAVIVGVASVVRETLTEQLQAGPRADVPRAAFARDRRTACRRPRSSLQVAQTWAQEALGRLLKRMGG